MKFGARKSATTGNRRMTPRRSPRDRRRRLVAKMRSIVAATARNAACFVLGSGDPRFDHRLPGFAVQHGLVARSR